MGIVTPCDVCGNVELNWDRDWFVSDEEWRQVVPRRWWDSTLCPWCFVKFAAEHGKQYTVTYYKNTAYGVKRVEGERMSREFDIEEMDAEQLKRLYQELKEKYREMFGDREDKCMDILLSIERELSHIISDVATFKIPSNEIARRIISMRDELRKTLRRMGYRETF